MNQPDAIDVLNRLLQLLYRSLPVYLRGCPPWARAVDRQAVELLDRIAADHCRYAHRLAEAIQNEDGRPDPGTFPTEFTAIHDVSVEYLLGKLSERQKREMETIEQCVAGLAGRPQLQALAQEILDNARENLAKLDQAAKK